MICIIAQKYYPVYISITPFLTLRLKFLVRMSNISKGRKNIVKKVAKNYVIG